MDSSLKLGWKERALASLDAPPSPLLALVGVVVVLLWISSSENHKAQMQTTLMGFRLMLLVLLLLAVIFVAHSVTKYDTVLVISPKAKGVAVLLALVVVLVSYLSYFHS